MTTTAGHSFYIGPIGSFYYQVNDTGSLELLVSLRIIRTTDRSEGINLSNMMHILGSISAIASEKNIFLYFPHMVLC
jgi:hypothetical protein